MTAAAPPAPTGLRLWWQAARPRTLPLAAAPVLVGTALAAAADEARWLPALAALVGGVLLQIGANFANDLFDAKSGADAEDRIGPPRAVQQGWITPVQMGQATGAALGAATGVGLYLVLVAGWPVVAVGLFAIVVALAYTGGPFPLGYHGLGDLTVFVCFGLVAVAGTYYVQALHVPALALVAGVPVGALATAVLVVNNVRDIESDTRAGKRTLAVRLGREAGVAEYAGLLCLAHLVPVGLLWNGDVSVGVLASLATAPFALRLALGMRGPSDGPNMNERLAATARLGLIHATLFAAGILVPR
jgi:1,4-dihydroxy-2-naphthoate octaprenyltransferase